MLNRRFYNEIIPFLMSEQEAIIISKDYEEFLGTRFMLHKSEDDPLYGSLNSWKIMTARRTLR